MIQQQNTVWELSSLVSLVGFACTAVTKNLCYSPRFGDSFRFTEVNLSRNVSKHHAKLLWWKLEFAVFSVEVSQHSM